MSEAAAAHDSDAPRSMTELLDRVAERQRAAGVEELTEDEALALAAEEARAAREELRKRGIR
ncbi:MAG TPA: hypothetical protein VF109_01370 [Mycobacteriales bacterium]